MTEKYHQQKRQHPMANGSRPLCTRLEMHNSNCRFEINADVRGRVIDYIESKLSSARPVPRFVGVLNMLQVNSFIFPNV